MYLYGTYRNRKPYDSDGDGFSEMPELKNSTIGIRNYYRIGSQSKISLEYHNINEYRRGGDQLDKPPASDRHSLQESQQEQGMCSSAGLSLSMRQEPTSTAILLFLRT